MRPFRDLLPPFPEAPLALAVSECLTGAPVRYDGGHRASAWPGEALQDLYAFRPICPEVGIGLGVPRAPIRLIGAAASPRAVGVEDASLDVTDRLRGFAQARLPELDDIHGYVFKARSPSCGVRGVALHPDRNSPAAPNGTGIFAAEIARARPDLPLADGEELFDAGALESFVTRTFVHAFWRRTTAKGLDAERLVAFHSACKYLVMAHDVSAYRRLGGLVADLSGNVEAVASEYFAALMDGLAKPATRSGHANVLQHLQGYLKGTLGKGERRELGGLIEAYRLGKTPLELPLDALKDRLRDGEADYAADQYYLHVPSGSVARELGCLPAPVRSRLHGLYTGRTPLEATPTMRGPNDENRRRTKGDLSAQESKHVVRDADLLRRATDLLGNEDAAVRWLRTPAPALGGETPMDHAATECGAQKVTRLIGRLEHGIPT